MTLSYKFVMFVVLNRLFRKYQFSKKDPGVESEKSKKSVKELHCFQRLKGLF